MFTLLAIFLDFFIGLLYSFVLQLYVVRKLTSTYIIYKYANLLSSWLLEYRSFMKSLANWAVSLDKFSKSPENDK